MEEQQRVVRAYSQDTERPYYQIRYRLSLTGRELLADAFNMEGAGAVLPMRNMRTDSVCTTFSSIPESHNNGDDAMVMDDEEVGELNSGNRVMRSQSMLMPSENASMAEFSSMTEKMPGTPRSNYRRGQQQQNDFGVTLQSLSGNDMQDNEFEQASEIRRSKSAGTMAELQMNRGAPAIPVDSLTCDNQDHLRGLKQVYPQFANEFHGLVTCLNSKNIAKYRVGQTYRKGVIVGMDEIQGKIIVFQKNQPLGTLIIMRSQEVERYEKGYTVQDVQGRIIGTVHAIDRKQNVLVINTTGNSMDNGRHSSPQPPPQQQQPCVPPALIMNL